MTYQIQHIQHTVNHIANRCTYSSVKEANKQLTKSHKRWVENELILAIDPLQHKNPKVIVLNRTNNKFSAFFSILDEEKILFPENTTYVLKRNGTSYECTPLDRIEIYNRPKMKGKGKTKKISAMMEELQEGMHALSLNSDSDYSSDSSVEMTEAPPLYTPLLKIPTHDKKIPWQQERRADCSFKSSAFLTRSY